MMRLFITYIFLFCLSFSIFSQPLVIRDFKQIREIKKESLNYDGCNVNVSCLPLYCSDLNYSKDTFKNNFLALNFKNVKNHYLQINPVFDFIAGINNNNNFIFPIAGGLMLDFGLKNKFAFSSIFYAQKNDLDFLQSFTTENTNIVYGLGRVRKNCILYGEWDLVYSPFKFLKVDFANSRNFYGYGYRSLLLSDFSSPYPHLKLEAKFLNFKYSFVLAKMINISDADFLPYLESNKFSAYHFLDWKISKRINIGIFESVISSKKDFWALEYLNPVVFFRPIEFNLGSEDNVLLGLNGRIIISKTSMFYFQFLLDDIIVAQLVNDIKHNLNPDYSGNYGWFANKWGLQVGIKKFDIFKIRNLDFFSECNIVRPYTYSHSAVERNYSHLHQPLAHPLGANFVEWLNGLSYYNERFYVDFKYIYAVIGVDTVNTHFGSNIFYPTMDGAQPYPYVVQSYGNVLLQGERVRQNTFFLEGGYYPFKGKNFSISGIVYMLNKNSETNYYFMLGLRSGLVRKTFP